MPDLFDEIKAFISKLAGNWASFIALGSFTIYVFGYLVVRFHLTVFGIGTDLAVFDERYLFAGAKFLVYLSSTIPILILLLLVLILIIIAGAAIVSALSWTTHKLAPNYFRARVGLTKRVCKRIVFFSFHPEWILKTRKPRVVTVVGIVFSVLFIQTILRQCFLCHDLLLANGLPSTIRDHWLSALLFDESGNSQYYYFCGLVIGIAFSLGLFLSAITTMRRSRHRALLFLQGLLLVLELLFLPINYGILVFDKDVPRVQGPIGQQELVKCQSEAKNDCQEAWLAWEGTEGETYLIREWKENSETRKLTTVPRKDIKKLEITSYDHIFTRLFPRQ